MRRRTLFTSAAAVGLLAACRIDDPVVKGSPAPTYTPPPPQPLAGAAEMEKLEGAAEGTLRRAVAAGWAGADGPRWAALADIRRQHRLVLLATDPLAKVPVAADPSTVTAANPAATKEAGLSECTGALVALRDKAFDLARATTGQPAALWASIGAAAEQARLMLAAPFTGVRPGTAMATVAATSDADALSALISRYHEAVYGLSSALGLLPIGHAARKPVSAELLAARAERDALVALDRSANATPPPGAGDYSLPSAATPDGVLALCDALQSSVAGAAGVWVASATTTSLPHACQALLTAATLGLGLGQGVSVWPGLP